MDEILKGRLRRKLAGKMNEMEVLVKKEKEASYNQRNKDLFTFYTLTLIKQEELKRRHRRNLVFVGLVSMTSALILLREVEVITDSFLGLILNLSIPLLYNLFYSYLVCLLFAGFVVLYKRKSLF
jgi:hypothetical protein